MIKRLRRVRRRAFALMAINAVCIVLCWTSRFNSWFAVLGMSGLALTTCFQICSYRLDKRRYEQAIRKHLESGGKVMLARRGRYWMAYPVPPLHADTADDPAVRCQARSNPPGTGQEPSDGEERSAPHRPEDPKHGQGSTRRR